MPDDPAIKLQSELPPPPVDDSGEVDMSLILENLALTPAQRFERHYRTRLFVEKLRCAGERFYGSLHPDPETS